MATKRASTGKKSKVVATPPVAGHGAEKSGRLTPPPGGVAVRMYRHGLGDCLLLALAKEKDKDAPFYIMIDCGVILGTEDAKGKIGQVLDNVHAATGGRLDVLVVTHEHWDHVSGFAQAKDRFAPAGASGRAPGVLEIERVWMGWTEDPSDKDAKAIRSDRAKKQQGLAAALQEYERHKKLGLATNEELPAGVGNLLSFFGMEMDAASGLFGAHGGTTNSALENARGFGRTAPRYCRPDDKPWSHEDLPDFRIFALGPPLSDRLLRKTFAKAEVYHAALSAAPADSFFAAAGGLEIEGETPEDLHECYCPFDPALGAANLDALKTLVHGSAAAARTAAAAGLPLGEPNSVVEFFDRHYWGRGPDAAPDQSWRRIDSDWLDASREFALQLDSATNNTSLVLAIELVKSGKVLLFAADAQVGSWLSWQDLEWKLDAATTVTGPDLLKRTVFYKVGHHGSHNATLKEKGLELMRQDEFVAFIPVNHQMAKDKGWGNMPLPSLVTELGERAKGRVVRIDEDFDLAKLKTRDAKIGKDFEQRLFADEGKLFYDYHLD